jgi:3-deoxy-manno-octulosonate cytidylyltransferase (CMP-KDO synthetase)
VVVFAVHPAAPQGTATITPPVSVVVVIPARYQSSRLPGKPLADIAGHPMVEHVYRRARAAACARDVIVATDDTRIRDAVAAFGGDARMTASSHRSGTERLAEVARELACDVVVNLQSDEPLVAPEVIDLAVDALGGGSGVFMSTIRCPVADGSVLDDPNVVKVVVDREDYALYFSRSPIPYRRNGGQDIPVGAYQHVGLYAYRRDFLLELAGLAPTPLEQAEQLEQLRALEHGYRIRTAEIAQHPVGVDTQEDLDRVRRLISAGAS